MIVFSVISNFWYPFGVFFLQFHFTHATWKLWPLFPCPKFCFQILSCQLKFSEQRSGFTSNLATHRGHIKVQLKSICRLLNWKFIHIELWIIKWSQQNNTYVLVNICSLKLILHNSQLHIWCVIMYKWAIL